MDPTKQAMITLQEMAWIQPKYMQVMILVKASSKKQRQ